LHFTITEPAKFKLLLELLAEKLSSHPQNNHNSTNNPSSYVKDQSSIPLELFWKLDVLLHPNGGYSNPATTTTTAAATGGGISQNGSFLNVDRVFHFVLDRGKREAYSLHTLDLFMISFLFGTIRLFLQQ
jgi:hypothetical protein